MYLLVREGGFLLVMRSAAQRISLLCCIITFLQNAIRAIHINLRVWSQSMTLFFSLGASDYTSGGIRCSWIGWESALGRLDAIQIDEEAISRVCILELCRHGAKTSLIFQLLLLDLRIKHTGGLCAALLDFLFKIFALHQLMKLLALLRLFPSSLYVTKAKVILIILI